MGQGERIEIVNPCPLTPSSKRSLKFQGIKKRLNLHSRPIPVLVTVSLAYILMAISLVIFLMQIPVDLLPGLHSDITPEFNLFRSAAVMWILVITVAAVLISRKLRPNLFNPPILVEVSLAYILMVGGLVILWMVMQSDTRGVGGVGCFLSYWGLN